MKSEEQLIKLRQDAEDMLKEGPEGIKIKLKKEYIEKLIFDNVVLNEELGIVLKIPVWTGPFLSKIDLSEVSFDDVSWSIKRKPIGREVDNILQWIDNMQDVNAPEPYDVWSDIGNFELAGNSNNNVLDFSNTNAVIDFSKSFEAKYFDAINIVGVNLANVDLSNNDFAVSFLQICASDLSNTKANISAARSFCLERSNFENADLSQITLNAGTFGGDLSLVAKPRGDEDEESLDGYYFEICIDTESNYRNTGINIVYDAMCEMAYSEIEDNEYESGYTEDSKYEFFDIKDNVYKNRKKESEKVAYRTYRDLLMQSGIFDGCKLNGVVIGDGIDSENILGDIRKQIPGAK